MPSGSITESQILQAIRQLNNNRPTGSKVVQDLTQTLEMSMDDGDFDGSLESAIECLSEEGFEIEVE